MLRKPTDQLAEDAPLTFTFDERHWRVRGLEKQRSSDRLRVTLHVSCGELSHVDTIDLYVARRRGAFAREAAAELEYVLSYRTGRGNQREYQLF